MKTIRLKKSVKVRGGKIFIPGMYDLSKESFKSLKEVLSGVKDTSLFEVIVTTTPPPVEGEVAEDIEQDSEEESEEEPEEESEEEPEEESEEKPKKKKKKKKVA